MAAGADHHQRGLGFVVASCVCHGPSGTPLRRLRPEAGPSLVGHRTYGSVGPAACRPATNDAADLGGSHQEQVTYRPRVCLEKRWIGGRQELTGGEQAHRYFETCGPRNGVAAATRRARTMWNTTMGIASPLAGARIRGSTGSLRIHSPVMMAPARTRNDENPGSFVGLPRLPQNRIQISSPRSPDCMPATMWRSWCGERPLTTHDWQPAKPLSLHA